MCVVLNAHPVRSESHIQRNVNREVPTTIPPFYNEPQRSHVVFVKSAPGMTFTSWSQHHFVRSESPSGMCAKLHTVAARNNRDHPMKSISYCLFAPRIYGCWSSHISCSWWITHSMQRQLRGCNSFRANWEVAIVLGIQPHGQLTPRAIATQNSCHLWHI